MITTRSYRTLTYKKAHGCPGKTTLQSRMEAALTAKKKSAAERCFDLDSDGVAFRGMDEIDTHKGMLVGTLMDVIKGSHHAVVASDVSKPTLSRTAAAPPENTEYLDSFLFFAVSGNNVVLVQSAALKAKQFEQYCNWLLHPADGEAAHPVTISDLPVKGLTKATGVKRISLSQPIEFSDPRVQKEIQARAHDKTLKKSDRKARPTMDQSMKVEVQGPVRDLIRRLLPQREASASSLRFDQALKAGRVKATVILEVTGRMTEEDAVPVVDEIAASLRHVDREDLDYKIKLNDGQEVTPDNLKYTRDVRVTCNDGIASFSEICEAMHDWLVDSIKRGRVY